MVDMVHERRDLLGHLSDGIKVWNRLDSDHLKSHPEVVHLLDEVFSHLGMKDFCNGILAKVIDLGRIVGLAQCVETGSEDKIFFARRIGRKKGVTRFVLHRKGEECKTVTIWLHLGDDGSVFLTTAYIGIIAPLEPCARSAQLDQETWEKSVAFWQNHALTFDGTTELSQNYLIRPYDPSFWGLAPNRFSNDPSAKKQVNLDFQEPCKVEEHELSVNKAA